MPLKQRKGAFPFPWSPFLSLLSLTQDNWSVVKDPLGRSVATCSIERRKAGNRLQFKEKHGYYIPTTPNILSPMGFFFCFTTQSSNSLFSFIWFHFRVALQKRFLSLFSLCLGLDRGTGALSQITAGPRELTFSLYQRSPCSFCLVRITSKELTGYQYQI